MKIRRKYVTREALDHFFTYMGMCCIRRIMLPTPAVVNVVYENVKEPWKEYAAHVRQKQMQNRR